MSARLTIHGRVHYSSVRPAKEVRFTRKVRQEGRLVEEVVNTLPILPDAPESPLRLGVPHVDPEDGVAYHVVPHLNPLDGWAPAEYWLAKYGLRTFEVLKALWLTAVFDAGMEFGSATKRFRCRDEAKVHAYLKLHPRAKVSKETIVKRKRELGLIP